jgi:hypothetical protein
MAGSSIAADVRELVEGAQDAVSAVFLLIESIKAREQALTSAELNSAVSDSLPGDIREATLFLVKSHCCNSDELRRIIDTIPRGYMTADQQKLISDLLKSECSCLVDACVPKGSDPRELLTGLVAYDGMAYLHDMLAMLRAALVSLFAQQLLTGLLAVGGDSSSSTVPNMLNVLGAISRKVSRWLPSLALFLTDSVRKFALRDGSVQYVETSTADSVHRAGVDKTTIDEGDSDDHDEDDLSLLSQSSERKKKKDLLWSPCDSSRIFFSRVLPAACTLLDDMAWIAGQQRRIDGDDTIGEEEDDYSSLARRNRDIVSAACLSVYDLCCCARQFRASDIDGRALDDRSAAVERVNMQSLAPDANMRLMSQITRTAGPEGAGPAFFCYNCDVYVPDVGLAANAQRKLSCIAKALRPDFFGCAHSIIEYLGRDPAEAGGAHVSRAGLYDDVLHEQYDADPFATRQSRTDFNEGPHQRLATQIAKMEERRARADLSSFLSDNEDDDEEEQRPTQSSADDDVPPFSRSALLDLLLGFLVPMESCNNAGCSSFGVLHLPTLFLAVSSAYGTMLRSESLTLAGRALTLLDEFAVRSPKFMLHLAAEEDELDEKQKHPNSTQSDPEQEQSNEGVSLLDVHHSNAGEQDGTAYRSSSMKRLFSLLQDLVNLVVLSPSVQHRRSARNVLTRVLLLLHSSTRRRCIVSLLANSPYSSLCSVLISLVKSEILDDYKRLLAISAESPLQESAEAPMAAGGSVVACLVGCCTRWVSKVKCVEKEFSEPLVMAMNLLRLWIIKDRGYAQRTGAASPNGASFSGLQFAFAGVPDASSSSLSVIGQLGEIAKKKKSAHDPTTSIISRLRRKVLAPLADLIGSAQPSSPSHAGGHSDGPPHGCAVIQPLSTIELFSLQAACEGLESALGPVK